MQKRNWWDVTKLFSPAPRTCPAYAFTRGAFVVEASLHGIFNTFLRLCCFVEGQYTQRPGSPLQLKEVWLSTASLPVGCAQPLYSTCRELLRWLVKPHPLVLYLLVFFVFGMYRAHSCGALCSEQPRGASSEQQQANRTLIWSQHSTDDIRKTFYNTCLFSTHTVSRQDIVF